MPVAQRRTDHLAGSFSRFSPPLVLGCLHPGGAPVCFGSAAMGEFHEEGVDEGSQVQPLQVSGTFPRSASDQAPASRVSSCQSLPACWPTTTTQSSAMPCDESCDLWSSFMQDNRREKSVPANELCDTADDSAGTAETAAQTATAEGGAVGRAVVAQWSVQAVGSWLESKGFGSDWVRTFAANYVDGKCTHVRVLLFYRESLGCGWAVAGLWPGCGWAVAGLWLGCGCGCAVTCCDNASRRRARSDRIARLSCTTAGQPCRQTAA